MNMGKIILALICIVLFSHTLEFRYNAPEPAASPVNIPEKPLPRDIRKYIHRVA